MRNFMLPANYYNDYDEGLSPLEVIENMFKHTDENGILYVHEFPDASENCLGLSKYYIKLKMNWTRKDAEKVMGEYKYLYNCLSKLAECYDDKADEYINIPDELMPIWDKYFTPLHASNLDCEFDYEYINAISDKIEIMLDITLMEQSMEKGETLTIEEMDFYNEFKDEELTEDEDAYFKKYMQVIEKAANERLGGSFYAEEVMFRARRVCKLIALNSPQVIIDSEAKLLTKAMAINAYCTLMEIADN